MLFDLPNHKELYQALLKRDPRFDGQTYVAVLTTGVFCRLTCPARKPKPENCTFYSTVAECIEAGFRPCKRCHPLRPNASADPSIVMLLQALEERPEHRWREGDIEKMGFDLSTVRRSFKCQYGMTFLEMARQRRLRDGFEALSDGGRVIDTQMNARFESASAFRLAFAGILGCPPGHLKPNAVMLADWVTTPLGVMIAVCSASHLHLLEFVERRALQREVAVLAKLCKGDLGVGKTPSSVQIQGELNAFFSGTSAEFKTPLAFGGTPFYRQVWEALRGIPPGTTRNYAELAKTIGRPTAMRAVARANGANPLALVVPCHRVIGTDGSLTGYGGGLWRKQRLLEIERLYSPPKPATAPEYLS